MRLIDTAAYCDLAAGARILEWDEGDKVLELRDDRVLKLFAVRCRLSWSVVDPPSWRFVRHARRLRAMDVCAPTPLDHFLCWKIRRFGVVYRRLPGRNLLAAEAAGELNESVTAELARFIASLHERGILFRSLHPGNILLLPTGRFGLVDIADMRFHGSPLTTRQRARNFVHLCRRAGHREFWRRIGWEQLLLTYCAASRLTVPARDALLEHARELVRAPQGRSLEAPADETVPCLRSAPR